MWIETAHQSLTEAGGDVVRTFQSEERFDAVVISGQLSAAGDRFRLDREQLADRAMSMLRQNVPVDQVAESLLAVLPKSEHAPFSVLCVLAGQANLVECDAPPLFMTRRGELLVLPVIEQESHGHLIRQCGFALQDGDHLAIVSEGYIHATGWDRKWGWREIATSIRRLTETRCDAEQLLGALVRSYWRLAGEISSARSSPPISVLAMFARPMRTATVWSGPPVRRKVEREILDKLIGEPGARIICGDTTAEIAARGLGAELRMEPRPEDGWAEVPPTSQLHGRPDVERMDLISEGLVTMGKARERIAAARRARDLPRKQDGATRLARLLLAADKVHFLIGLAVNPAQTADKAGQVPLRRIVVQDLMDDLKALGKIVSVEYF